MYCHLLIHAEIYIYILDTYRRNDKDRRRKTSLTKYLPLTLLQGFEKVIQGLRMRGSLRPNRNCNILTPNLWPATLSLSWGPLCWVLAFFTASYQQPLWSPSSIGVPKCPHRSGVAFPTTSRYSDWHSNSVLTELYNSPRPLDCPSIFEIACLIVIKRK